MPLRHVYLCLEYRVVLPKTEGQLFLVPYPIHSSTDAFVYLGPVCVALLGCPLSRSLVWGNMAVNDLLHIWLCWRGPAQITRLTDSPELTCMPVEW
jgi:hypothetical protein